MTSDVRRSAAATCALVATAAVTAVFLTRFRPSLLLLTETLRPAAAALIVVLAAIGCGSAAIALSRKFFVTHIEAAIPTAAPLSDALAIGYAVLGTIAAAAGLVTTTASVAATIIAAAYGGSVVWRQRTTLRWPRAWAPLSLLLVPPLLIAAATAIVPVNSPDELIYKLAIPHAYQLYGRVIELPLASNSYLVMAIHSADIPALILGGGVAAKLSHLALYVTALLIIARFAGMWTAVAVAWTPALMVIAGWSWSEWGVLALLILSYARYEEGDWAVAATALGCAAASKYTALPWIAAFAIVVLIRRRDERALLLRAAVVTALFGAFFYVRNLVWTGSPVAPLFLPHAPQVTGYRGGGILSGWLDFVRGTDIFDARIVDESLGILLPIAFILGIFAIIRRERRELLLTGLLQMCVLLTIAPGSRNMINGVVAVAIVGIALGREIYAASAPALRALMATFIAIALAAQLVLTIFILEPYEIVPYLAGKETAAQYMSRMRSFARPYDWIAKQTAPSARILLLGETRTFYLQRPFLAAANLDGPRVAAWLARFTTPDELRRELVAQHITHVVLHKPWYRIATAGAPPPGMLEKEYVLEVPPQVHAVLTTLLNTHSVLRYRDGEYLIYELR